MCIDNIVRNLMESKLLLVESNDSWEYWEMPKDHRGPWIHPQYTKNYGDDIVGFIYPPYEATSRFLKDMTHEDYVAELYDNTRALGFDEKSFDNIEDAKAWLDELAEYTLSHMDESGVYSPYDHSNRDNNDYNSQLKSEEAGHPYVGKKVRYFDNNRSYTVTGAYEDSRGITVRCGDITMRPGDYKLVESADSAEYICKDIVVDSNGVMEIICYDTVEDEEFEKYIGHVDSYDARKSARLLLRDYKFEVPKEIRNELIGTFGLEDFGFQIEE